MTLAQALEAARWPGGPLVFHTAEIILSTAVFFISIKAEMPLIVQLLSLLVGPVLMRWILVRAVKR